MNKVKSLQDIKSNQQNKYDEIIEYLKQDNGYWLENDIWDLKEKFFLGEGNCYHFKYLDFCSFQNEYLKNEVKFYIVYGFKNQWLKKSTIAPLKPSIQKLAEFSRKEQSFLDFDLNNSKLKWEIFLRNNGINGGKTNTRYYNFFGTILDFIKDFYDDREETEKDIWYSKNINGVKKSVTSDRTAKSISFIEIPLYYREIVKRYLKTIITKKSWIHCFNVLNKIKFFFNYFYSNGYTNGFIETLSRTDIEKYLYHIGNERKGKNPTETSKYISYIRTFLEYIQMSQYDKAPKKEVSFLIFQDDIPKRELRSDEVKN